MQDADACASLWIDGELGSQIRRRRSPPASRSRHPLLAIAQGLVAVAELGQKEHDRLALARPMMEAVGVPPRNGDA